jgi:hypothetical protein
VSAVTYCAEWLGDELHGGPGSKPEIVRAAHAVGFTEKQLRTAREQLGVQSQRHGFGPRSAAWWSLPDSDGVRTSPYVPTDENNCDPELAAALAWLDQQIPTGTTRDPVELFRNAEVAGVNSATLLDGLAVLGPSCPRRTAVVALGRGKMTPGRAEWLRRVDRPGLRQVETGDGPEQERRVR